MARTLVTGGTGLIGSHLVRALLARGDDVRVAARTRSPVAVLEGLDVEVVRADVLDHRAVRRAMGGVDVVFHCAGTTSLRAPAELHERVHVQGTRVVLEEALAAGVARAVHVSSFAAVGPVDPGKSADETLVFRGGRVGLPYVNSKHEAEVEALRLAAAGLRVVIVNPGLVLGPGVGGDAIRRHHTSIELVRRFLQRDIPAYVDGALCIVHVSDVVDGMLLAEQRGRVGERYILGNRNFTLERLFADLGRLSGVAPPALKLPLPAAVALARSLRGVPGAPRVVEEELRAMSLCWSLRSTKAKRELGYAPRHHEDALTDTIAWLRAQGVGRPPGTGQPLPLRLAGFAAQRAGGALGLVRGR